MFALIGKKIQQSQKFLTDGTRIPVTRVEVVGNPVIAIKTKEKDGYIAVQLGYGTKKHANKSLTGHIKGAKLEKAPSSLREVRFPSDVAIDTLPHIGDVITADSVFKVGDIIDVRGISKGKGFAGGVKRYHFKGGPRTHGQSDRERAPGSIGQTTTPGRVYKGKRMAGKMGNEYVTIQNVTIVEVADGYVLINGLIPGVRGSSVFLTKKGEMKKFVPLLQEEVQEPIKADVVVEEVVAEEPVQEAHVAPEEEVVTPEVVEGAKE